MELGLGVAGCFCVPGMEYHPPESFTMQIGVCGVMTSVRTPVQMHTAANVTSFIVGATMHILIP